MKYPINTTMITEARMYARESLQHTLDYDGWKDGYKKMNRIVTGTFCQLWLCEYCRLNGIPYKADKSSPYVADNGDLHVCGYNIDCKSSIHSGLDGQISSHHDHKNNNVDVYAFFRTDVKISYIEPLGMLFSYEVHDNSKKINDGEIIPGTNIKQRFGYSYFVDIDYLTPLDQCLNWMIENSKQQSDSM